MTQFLWNQSYLPYYLLAYILLWSYWPFRIPCVEYILFEHFIFTIPTMISFLKSKLLLLYIFLLLLLVIQYQWVFFLHRNSTVTLLPRFIGFFCNSSLYSYHSELSYYLYIPIFLTWPLSARLRGVIFSSVFIPEELRRSTVAVVFCCCLFFFFVSSTRMSVFSIESTFRSYHIIAI